MAAGKATLSTIPGCSPDDRESPPLQLLLSTTAFKRASIDFHRSAEQRQATPNPPPRRHHHG